MDLHTTVRTNPSLTVLYRDESNIILQKADDDKAQVLNQTSGWLFTHCDNKTIEETISEFLMQLDKKKLAVSKEQITNQCIDCFANFKRNNLINTLNEAKICKE